MKRKFLNEVRNGCLRGSGRAGHESALASGQHKERMMAGAFLAPVNAAEKVTSQHEDELKFVPLSKPSEMSFLRL